MHFCTICGSLTNINVDAEGVTFICGKCDNVMPGTAEDTLISGDPTSVTGGDFSQQIFIEQAARDPTSFKVYRVCECGMDYAARVYIGHDMTMVHVCLCGRRS